MKLLRNQVEKEMKNVTGAEELGKDAVQENLRETAQL